MRKAKTPDVWLESWKRTETMFKESGVYYGFI